MAKPAKRPTAEIYWNGEAWVARVTIEGKDREVITLATCRTEAQANERGELVGKAAKRLRRAGVIRTTAALELLWKLGACEAAYLPTVLKVVGKLAGGEWAVKESDVPTFATVGRQWTDGELHERFPDRVKAVEHELNESRLEKLYAINVGGVAFGDVPIDMVSEEHAEEAMRNLPADVTRSATRKQYAMLINRVMKLARYPLRLIKANPLADEFVRVVNDPPIKYTYLRPAEDALLMGCTALPLCWRLFFGFCAREGTRAGEALQFQVRDFNFRDGSINLPENKTNAPRDWLGDPAVMRCLEQWVCMRGAEPGDFMFTDEGGAPVVDDDRLAEKLRAHLLRAGAERHAIHNDTFHRTTKRQICGKLREHDLRATFVTLSLRNGKTRDWIRARTGQSDQTIARYTRDVQGAEDRNLGELTPLDEAIPEFTQRQPTRAQWLGAETTRAPV